MGPSASLDRRDPLQGIGSLAQRWEAPLSKLQALPVWWLREPGALAEDPGLTISTQSTKRKPELGSSKARARRTQILFAIHSVGRIKGVKYHVALQGGTWDFPGDTGNFGVPLE